MNFHYGGYDFRKDLEPTIISFAVSCDATIYGNTGLQTDIYSQIVDESLHNVPLNNHRATEYNLWSMKKAFYVNPLCQYYEMFLQFFDSLAFVLSGLQKC